MAKKTATAPVASAPKPPKAAPKKTAKSATPAAEMLTDASAGALAEVAATQASDAQHNLPVGRQPAPAGLAVAAQHQTPASLPPPADGQHLGAAAEAPYIEVYGARSRS